MRIWFENIGDVKPINITPDSWDMPGKRSFLAVCEDNNTDKHVISWDSFNRPSLIDDPTYPERFAEEQQKIADALARFDEIQTARNGSGIQKYTVVQATNYITNKMDSITSLATAKEVIKEILLKMVPYLLD